MGGTIRAALNLAGYLADHYEVEIISVFRRRDESFFGSFPPGIRVSALDDQRPERIPGGLRGSLRALLRGRKSMLMHPIDHAASEFNLCIDVQLARRLHRKAGYFITTRPGLNLLAAQLSPPGLTLIGQEQMHLGNHNKAAALRDAEAVSEARRARGADGARPARRTRRCCPPREGAQRPAAAGADPQHGARDGRREGRPRRAGRSWPRGG